MAYAALVSLEKTTHLILNHHKYSDFVGGRKQITSIHELLIPFLEKFPEKSNPLEEKIRALAYEAEDLIEYSMSDKSGMSWWRFLLSRVKFQRRLKRVRDEMGSIYAEMKDGRFNDLPATNSSSRVAASGESRNSKWAISKLVNLQTLIIRRSTYSTFPPFLPKEIWQMQQLRHLVFPRRCILRCPTYRQTIPLENLQTLSGIASFVGSERILEMIPNLKKLSLFYFINRKRHHLHNLENLHQLEKLKITWSFSWLGRYPAFPRTLKKLTLVGGQLPWKDMSIVGSLPNLQVLKLKNYACYGDAWETRDEEFPQLEFLLIEQSYLENWITENLPLPRLKCLMLHDCPNLREIPECIGEIPTLQVIEVYIENESLVNSATQIQEDQLNYGNDALQVRCIETTPFKFVASVADQTEEQGCGG
ncbi:hypothetical protein ACS0TY_023640 [Phlomoides rotata]